MSLKDNYWKAISEANIDFMDFSSAIDEFEYHNNYKKHIRYNSSRPRAGEEDISNELLNQMDMVSRVFSLQQANPNDPYKVAAYKYLYTPTSTLEDLKEKISESMHSLPHSRPIVLIGERGSGKTTVQNKLFTGCKKYMDENNIVFVRCDAHKIFDLWRDYSGGRVEAGITTYLYLQTLYVAIKYGYMRKESKPLEGLVGKCLGIELNTWINNKGNDYSIKSTFAERLTDIVNDISNEVDQDPSSSAMITAYKSVLGEGALGIKYKKWMLLAEKLVSKSIESGYKLLFVVDGVDNILWHKNIHRESYKRMIDEIDSFTEGSKIYIRLVCLREESIIKCIAGDPSSTIFSSNTDFVPVYHSPPHISQIISNKISLLKDKQKLREIFGDKYVNHRTNNEAAYEYLLKQIEVYSKKFFSETEKYVCDIRGGCVEGDECPECSCSDIINHYHNNLRAYCFNMISYLSSAIREISSIKSQDGVTALLNREVYRNYFLDGKNFIRTTNAEDGSERKGGVLFNIFWYDTNKLPKENTFIGENESWYGLCVFRLYQTLLRYRRMEHDKLVEFVCFYFHYPKNLVVDAIKKCITFGLFMYKLNPVDSDELSHVIMATPKAELCMDIVFSKVDVLYYLALDCPLSSKDISVVGMHSDIGRYKFSFLESALRSSCYLLAHISRQHRIDLHNAQESISSQDKYVSSSGIPRITTAQEFSRTFPYPIVSQFKDKLNRNLDRMISSLERESSSSHKRTCVHIGSMLKNASNTYEAPASQQT